MEAPSDPLDASDTLVFRWKSPFPDTQASHMFPEQARMQHAASTSASASCNSSFPPTSYTSHPSSPSPFTLPFPISYRFSHDPCFQPKRTSTGHIHAPIASLPDDLLLNVFEYVAGERTEDAERRLAWLIVTFVCRFWRHVAIASSSLWNYIPMRTPGILLTFAKRAKDLPLDLVFEGTAEKENMFTAVQRISVYSLAPRIRSLQFFDRTVPWFEIVRYLPTNFPRLEVLKLDGMEYWSTSAEETPIGHLLGDGAPALRTLSVIGCSFLPALLPKCQWVTRLCLARNANFISAEVLLNILSALPYLETFYFEMLSQHRNLHEDTGASGVSEREMVRLPSIRLFALQYIPHAAAYILAHVELPPNASISLSFPTTDGSLLTEYSQLLQHIPALPTLTHLAVHETASTVLLRASSSFSSAEKLDMYDPSEGSGEQQFCLRYRRDYNFDQHFESVAKLMPAVTSVSMHLHMGRRCRSMYSSVSEGSWRGFLTHLPRVVELRVSSNFSFSHRALLRVLREVSATTQSVHACKTCLPALETLQFTDLVLNEDKCDCGCREDGCAAGAYGKCSAVDPQMFYAQRDTWNNDHEYVDSAAVWIEGLRRCLEMRSVNGAAPLRIRFTAGSPKKWRASSCHHGEVRKIVGELAELEFAAPGS